MDQHSTKSNIRKILEWFGIVGACSCYFAMFPLSILGVLGLLGISTIGIVPALKAYMVSPLFQPILIASIILLVLGTVRLGKIAVILSLLAGILVFASMNIYMQAWIFLLAFLIIALAQVIGSYQRGLNIMGRDFILVILPLLLITAVLGISTYFLSPAKNPSPMKPPAISPSTMPMQ